MQTDERSFEQLRLGRTGSRWTLVAGLLGLAGIAATALLAMGSEAARQQFFRSYLVNFTYFLSLALGALFFVIITHLTRAGWSVALRRLAETVSWTLLPLAALALVVLFGMHDLYEWTHAEAVAGDPLLQGKAGFLNPTFFIVRLVGYFLIWNLLAWYFSSRSLAQDSSGEPGLTVRMEKVSAPGAILFALTVTFAAFDLIMSLYPHWYSTIFGVYYFAGAALGFFSLNVILMRALEGAGKLTRVVHVGHYHDMGKLVFAFVVFWAYIAFSQYMLIWYANIPEETMFYKLRQEGSWVGVSLVLLFGHFILPFLFLISRHPKRRRTVLALAAAWVLVMHWFDLFYLVVPGSRPADSIFSLLDLTCFVGLGGLFFAAVFWRMGRVNLVAARDPRLGESLGLDHV
jgi:hypothetical protein